MQYVFMIQTNDTKIVYREISADLFGSVKLNQQEATLGWFFVFDGSK